MLFNTEQSHWWTWVSQTLNCFGFTVSSIEINQDLVIHFMNEELMVTSALLKKCYMQECQLIVLMCLIEWRSLKQDNSTGLTSFDCSCREEPMCINQIISVIHLSIWQQFSYCIAVQAWSIDQHHKKLRWKTSWHRTSLQHESSSSYAGTIISKRIWNVPNPLLCMFQEEFPG